MFKEWFKRLFGYGAAAAAGYVATKTGSPELGAAVGVVGGAVLNYATQRLIPRAEDLVTKNLRP